MPSDEAFLYYRIGVYVDCDGDRYQTLPLATDDEWAIFDLWAFEFGHKVLYAINVYAKQK